MSQSGPAAGPAACNRTVRVFDGWQRYDVKLSFKESKHVQGATAAYSGEVFVCAARYVPVAGHRPESRVGASTWPTTSAWRSGSLRSANTTVFVPYRIIIGTQVGDLVSSARAISR